METNTAGNRPTDEMIQNLAEYVVNGMSYQELTQRVYEDIYTAMLEDHELFHNELDQLGFEPEQFTNNKYRGTK